MHWLFAPSLFDRVQSSSFRALPVRMHEKPPSVFVCRVLWIVDLWCKPMSYGGLPTDVENFITIAHREATQKWNGNKTNISGSTRCEIKISLVDQFGFRNNFARIFHNFISIQNLTLLRIDAQNILKSSNPAPNILESILVSPGIQLKLSCYSETVRRVPWNFWFEPLPHFLLDNWSQFVFFH